MEPIPGTIIFKNHAKVLRRGVEYRAPAGKGGFARLESHGDWRRNIAARPPGAKKSEEWVKFGQEAA